jgi:hypothetical protein
LGGVGGLGWKKRNNHSKQKKKQKRKINKKTRHKNTRHGGGGDWLEGKQFWGVGAQECNTKKKKKVEVSQRPKPQVW